MLISAGTDCGLPTVSVAISGTTFDSVDPPVKPSLSAYTSHKGYDDLVKWVDDYDNHNLAVEDAFKNKI